MIFSHALLEEGCSTESVLLATYEHSKYESSESGVGRCYLLI